MGGQGSTKRYGPKGRVEQSITLAISWMLQNNYLDLSVGQRGFHTIVWRNYRNEPRYILTAELEHAASNEMRLYLSSTGQIVSPHATALHFGGVRWWFRCPGCWRRCAKLYRDSGSVFLCRICHDLTYESCIEGKSTSAFLGVFCAQQGLNEAELKRAIAEDTRARNTWRRKRDRRASYRARPGHQPEIPEKSLKRAMLEAKAVSELAKSLGRLGMC